jgi:methionine synthase II (cobalamin-independent)
LRAGTLAHYTAHFTGIVAPGWLDHFIFNEYYKTEEEFLFALGDALREEYRAVVAAGFVLQIDDPGLPDWWDMLKPEPTIAAYRKFARLRIDAVNHALVGIPEERVRYHLCWGSWHGPHTHDLPLEIGQLGGNRCAVGIEACEPLADLRLLRADLVQYLRCCGRHGGLLVFRPWLSRAQIVQ